MDWTDLETYFSNPRLGRYLSELNQDQGQAAAAYAHNLRLTEALFPLLNVLEIALRNRIHHQLQKAYGQANWWDCWTGDTNFTWQNKEIHNAKAKLKKRKESQSPDKILAELTFGFWCSLFNTGLQALLWKDLRLVFAHCPKNIRQRNTISPKLNQMRDLRNRAFHHEPLLWLTPALFDQYTEGLTIIKWIDPKLSAWLQQHDRMKIIWQQFP